MNDIFNIGSLLGLSAMLFAGGYFMRDDLGMDEEPRPIVREYEVIEPEELKDPGWHSYLCNDQDCKHPKHGRKVGL